MTDYLQQITDIDLVSILPDSVGSDADIAASAGAVEDQIQAVATDIQTALPLMPNLDNLSSRIINLLAWQYHLDFYDPTADIALRRQRVREAIAEHRLAGTRAGLSMALASIWGEGNFTIAEWWEWTPAGDPFTFYVLVHVPFTSEEMERAQQMAAVVGNVRSLWVGYITWNQLDALTHTWNALDALALTWEQFELYYLFGPG